VDKDQTLSNLGFSLIEVAIVVLIIGLVIGLVFKGRDLMDQVIWKRDVQSYEHLQAAILLFREDRGKMPGDQDHDGIIQGRETKAAYEELIGSGGLEERDFEFKTGGPLYFSFTECEKVGQGYDILYTKGPKGTCLFPSKLKPWELDSDQEVDPRVTSERIVCIFEVGLDDKDVFSSDIRRTNAGSTWGQTINTKMQGKESALDCFGSDISAEPTNRWQDAVIIGLR
jgi:prepilin-type N-terminal cleavage/methylation domain-containing protein